MQFDVAPEVSDEDITLIRCGLARGQDFLDRELGGGISDDVLANITVKVEATGEGDQHPNGGGNCCTVVTGPDPEHGDIRIFFDVLHPHWTRTQEAPGWGGFSGEAQREKVVIHELAHAWHGSLGCLGALGGSLWDEGIAEQVTYAHVIEKGLLTKQAVMDFVEAAAKSGNGEQWYIPLPLLESNQVGVWSGHIGYLALEFGINMESAPHGLMSVRMICEKVADGATPEEAFQTTFGTDKHSFYVQFELWKAQRP